MKKGSQVSFTRCNLQMIALQILLPRSVLVGNGAAECATGQSPLKATIPISYLD